MKVRLLAFATASDALGTEEREIEVAEGFTVEDLQGWLGERYPDLAPLWPRLAIAVDGEICSRQRVLTEGCEVALLPPVSGGSGRPGGTGGTTRAALVAIRLHLDETPSSGGALRVIPASHRHGRLSSSQIRWMRKNNPTETCPVSAGGAMVMSPLLVHASSPAETPSHRRVLHFEFAGSKLPGGLEWV